MVILLMLNNIEYNTLIFKEVNKYLVKILVRHEGIEPLLSTQLYKFRRFVSGTCRILEPRKGVKPFN